MSWNDNIIKVIQREDPSFNPLSEALESTQTPKNLWDAATDRVYFDGYYGPIKADDWKEQDGREPYTVSEALKIISKVLEAVTDYRGNDEEYIEADDIRKALVAPWYQEIYGRGYPTD